MQAHLSLLVPLLVQVAQEDLGVLWFCLSHESPLYNLVFVIAPFFDAFVVFNDLLLSLLPPRSVGLSLELDSLSNLLSTSQAVWQLSCSCPDLLDEVLVNSFDFLNHDILQLRCSIKSARQRIIVLLRGLVLEIWIVRRDDLSVLVLLDLS